MAREKGTSAFAANFEAEKAAPIDARMRVENRADLLLSATWTAADSGVYTYVGMLVVVYADSISSYNGLYRLTAADYTDINNWELLGSGGSGEDYHRLYVFEDVTERDAYFAANPTELVTDLLIAIKDTTPPPTPGTRNLDFSKSFNSQYKILLSP